MIDYFYSSTDKYYFLFLFLFLFRVIFWLSHFLFGLSLGYLGLSWVIFGLSLVMSWLSWVISWLSSVIFGLSWVIFGLCKFLIVCKVSSFIHTCTHTCVIEYLFYSSTDNYLFYFYFYFCATNYVRIILQLSRIILNYV